nr:MAG TPA: hypothetical protein [Caudoviricetes sp.]
MTNKGWCEYCYLKDEKPCYECNACFKGSNFRAIKTIKPTNYERIKNMSVEELAQTLFNHQFGHCSECAFKNKECSGNYFDDLSCIFGIKKWLLSEAKDNG